MKIKGNYTVAELAGEYVAVPLGEGDFRGVVKLNESGAEVFRGLIAGEQEEQLIGRLTAKYPGLDRETAAKAVALVLEELKEADLLEA